MPHQSISNRNRANARKMRRKMTDAELKLWNELRAHRLMGLGFKRQMPIGDYIVDFACPEYKLVLEVDGSGHGEQTQLRNDEKRTRYMNECGWQVLRFWNDDVMNDIDATCDHIIAILKTMGAEFE